MPTKSIVPSSAFHMTLLHLPTPLSLFISFYKGIFLPLIFFLLEYVGYMSWREEFVIIREKNLKVDKDDEFVLHSTFGNL